MSDTKAYYRRLGQSGLRVSVPIFGAMSLGDKNWQPWVVEGKEAIEILKAAWDRGITTFDTSNTYSNGASESLVGQFMSKYNIPRSKITILTKCFFLSTPKTMSNFAPFRPDLLEERDNVNEAGLSRAAIFNQVDMSLERLESEYIDVLQIHRFDKETPVEETMQALHDLVRMGKVRYIGASSMRAWQFALMNEVAARNGWTKFTSMQNEYSLLYREEEREMIPYCKYHGIGIIPWAPLAYGALTHPLNPSEPVASRNALLKGTPLERKSTPASDAIINRVEELAQKKGWTMAQVSLAWVAHKVDSPIVGLDSVGRVEEDILGKEKSLTDEEVRYLEEP
ncbi:Aldo/keto reductase [Flagelloscypha sp. PMI_526]|nr:Aldo/keto reductase [Flagelloscypha sp. PMI_526]